MVASIALSIVSLMTPRSAQDSFERYIKDLLHWRAQFEEVLDYSENDTAYHHVGSETRGGAHGDAIYPLGSAAERYMLSFNVDDEIIYQKRRGKRAVVVWRLPLVKSGSTGQVRGTIPKYLQLNKLRISPKAKVSSAIRRQLAMNGHFAIYSYHHMQGGYANVVRPDGTNMKVHHGDDRFVITPEEKQLLRASKKWATKRRTGGAL